MISGGPLQEPSSKKIIMGEKSEMFACLTMKWYWHSGAGLPIKIRVFSRALVNCKSIAPREPHNDSSTALETQQACLNQEPATWRQLFYLLIVCSICFPSKTVASYTKMFILSHALKHAFQNMLAANPCKLFCVFPPP